MSDEEAARRAEEAMQRAEAAIRAAREQLGANRLAELDAHQQLILSVTANGYGKRTSAYEYRVTNRGGQGIINIETSRRNGPVVAAFPVADDDQVMLVTDRGQVIRIPVDDIRIAGRNTQGVTLFDVAEDEHVVAVARLAGAAEANGGAEPDEPRADPTVPVRTSLEPNEPEGATQDRRRRAERTREQRRRRARTERPRRAGRPWRAAGRCADRAPGSTPAPSIRSTTAISTSSAARPRWWTGWSWRSRSTSARTRCSRSMSG